MHLWIYKKEVHMFALSEKKTHQAAASQTSFLLLRSWLVVLMQKCITDWSLLTEVSLICLLSRMKSKCHWQIITSGREAVSCCAFCSHKITLPMRNTATLLDLNRQTFMFLRSITSTTRFCLRLHPICILICLKMWVSFHQSNDFFPGSLFAHSFIYYNLGVSNSLSF